MPFVHRLRFIFLAMLLLPLASHAPAQLGHAAYARVIVKLRQGATVLQTGQSGTSQAQSSSAQLEGATALATTQPMRRLGQRRGLGLQDGRQISSHMHVAMAEGLSSEALAAQLAQDSDVEWAEPDHWRKTSAVPTDPLYAAGSPSNTYVPIGQWYLRASNASTPAAINAEPAWNTTTGTGMVVAVLDTGVRLDHPDLRSKWVMRDSTTADGYNMISDSVRAGNVARGPDASDLGDWLTSGEVAAHPDVYTSCDLTDSVTSSWHGTQVSGIVGAASNNGVGMASLGWDVKVLPVRVLGKCGGWDSDIQAGMLWAAGIAVPGIASVPALPANVINLSLGGATACTAGYLSVINQLAARNVVVVASAGNSNGQAVEAPANCPGVIAVAGLRHIGTKVGYSAVGPEVTVSAPGGNCANADDSGACIYPILTTTNLGATTPITDANGGSSYSNNAARASLGTSFSAPMVSGAVALMLANRSTLTPAAIASLLRSTARAFPTTGAPANTAICKQPDGSTQVECYCTTTTCGAGMLDVGQAVAAAQTGAVAVVQTNPSAAVPGQTISISGSASLPSTSGSTISSYQWTLLDGGGIVSALAAGATSADRTATASAAGFFKVRLTVLDDHGVSATSDRWVRVASLPATSNNSGSSGGGGGGAADVLSLLVLLAGVWCVRRVRAGSAPAQ
jgi:serine protease